MAPPPLLRPLLLAALFAVSGAAAAHPDGDEAKAEERPEAPAEATGDDLPPELAEPTPAKKTPSNGSVSDEVSGTGADSTPNSLRGGSIANAINASFNLGEQWSIAAGFTYLVNQGTQATSDQPIPDRGGKAASFTAGLDWDSGEHAALGLILDFSPQSTNVAGTSLQVDTTSPRGVVTTNDLDVRLRTESWGTSAALAFSWDTAGESDLEWVFSLGATGSHQESGQAITGLVPVGSTEVWDLTRLRTYCAAHASDPKKKCSKALTSLLGAKDSAALDSLELTAGAMATLYADTDLGITADGWIYAQDPAAFLGFDVTGARTSLSAEGGVPIAPMRADLRLDATHRFGAFSVRLSGSAGQYVDGAGGSTFTGGLRLQYKFSHAFRLWLTLSTRRDVDAGSDATISRSASLGAGLRF